MLGSFLIIGGTAMIYRPAAVILAGAALIVFAYFGHGAGPA
jgi:hypothetical protein